MKDTKKAAYNAPAFDRYVVILTLLCDFRDDCDHCFHRIALLQRQLLEVRDKIGYTKFQHSRKGGGPSDNDKQELCELETRERSILGKIADAKQQLEMEEIFDDTISVGYVCNKCNKTIEGVCIYVCVSVFVCVCMCVCVCMYVYMHVCTCVFVSVWGDLMVCHEQIMNFCHS